MTPVFAVEDTAVQLVWPALAPGEHRVAVGDRTIVVLGDGAAVAAVVDGLPPDTALPVVVDGRRVASVRTLPSPPGRELFRFATIGDVHIGDGWTFGVLPTITAPVHDIVTRCARAAIAEARAWGAELLVVKGDLTHHASAEEWALAADVLAGGPVIATIGNHDVKHGRPPGYDALLDAGVEVADHAVVVRDVPGARLILGDTAQAHRHPGTLHHVGPAIVDAAASTDGGVVVLLHHQLLRTPFPTHWPPGVFAPGSLRFLGALSAARPSSMVTSGHTHRCRARRMRSLLVTEVGSTKDHPGGWAGYVVHEGGIRQVVRRTMDPVVLRWTEDTKRALFGIWGRWSPGRLDDRCISHAWEKR